MYVLTTTQIEGIVRRHLPRGWLLIEQAPKDCRGLTRWKEESIQVKRIVDRATLFVFLHEVGHVRCRHEATVVAHVEEYEAERYAIATMRHEGVPIPRDEMYWAKENVRDCIKRDRKRGVKIDPAINKWSRA